MPSDFILVLFLWEPQPRRRWRGSGIRTLVQTVLCLPISLSTGKALGPGSLEVVAGGSGDWPPLSLIIPQISSKKVTKFCLVALKGNLSFKATIWKILVSQNAINLKTLL